MNPYKKDILANNMIQLELPITRRCNLKCKNCSFYCNINKIEDEILYPLEQVEKDLTHLKSLGIKIQNITIIGGEPTLVKNLTDYLYLVRRIINPEVLLISTNTVSLMNLCNHKGIKALKDTKAAILYTKYPDFVNNKSLSYLKSFGICTFCIAEGYFWKKTYDNYIQYEFSKQTLLPSDTGDSKKEEHFKKCDCDLLTLCNGRIYTCSKSLHIKFLNKKFGFNYPEDCYIEVSSLTSADELLTFSKTPGKLCSFCANADPANAVVVPWSQEPAEVTDYVDNTIK